MEKFLDNFQPDTYYHVYNHAIGHENLFRNTGNYHYFLKKYAEYLYPVCQTYAYCLMPNHFHLLIKIRSSEELIAFHIENERRKGKEINEDDISSKTLDFHKTVMLQFQHFLNGYAQAINKQFSRKGGLFLNHLKRIVVPTDSYFTSLIHYIHFNPVHHGFCKDLRDWQHSSYNAFLLEKATRLERDEILNWFGNREQYLRFHQQALDTSRFSEIEFA
jgi:REP element-mobilizing transposase RayT